MLTMNQSENYGSLRRQFLLYFFVASNFLLFPQYTFAKLGPKEARVIDHVISGLGKLIDILIPTICSYRPLGI